MRTDALDIGTGTALRHPPSARWPRPPVARAPGARPTLPRHAAATPAPGACSAAPTCSGCCRHRLVVGCWASPPGRAHAVGAADAARLAAAFQCSTAATPPGIRRVGHATVDDIPGMAHAFVIGSVAMWLYFQITPAGKLVFSALLAFVAIAFALSLALRAVVRRLAQRAVRPRAGAVRGQRPDDADPRPPGARPAAPRARRRRARSPARRTAAGRCRSPTWASSATSMSAALVDAARRSIG